MLTSYEKMKAINNVRYWVKQKSFCSQDLWTDKLQNDRKNKIIRVDPEVGVVACHVRFSYWAELEPD